MCITSCGTKSAASSDNPQEDSPSVTEQHQPRHCAGLFYARNKPRHARRIQKHRVLQKQALEKRWFRPVAVSMRWRFWATRLVSIR